MTTKKKAELSPLPIFSAFAPFLLGDDVDSVSAHFIAGAKREEANALVA
jgi:hypothetical protein